MAARTTFCEVNGVPTYVAQWGEGAPVLLLHGGLETVDMLPHLTAGLAARYHVIAPERRGHGRTRDIAGPITYSAMATDTLGVMDALGIETPHLVGYSDGANIAMLLAMAHPERVERLVLVSGNFHAAGMTPRFRAELQQAHADAYAPACDDAYRRLSPDGAAHWPVVFEKVRRMWLEEPALTAHELASIEAPTLVLAGEDDYVSVEHTRALAAAIGGARLVLLAGGGKGVLAEQPVLTTRLIVDFIEAPMERDAG